MFFFISIASELHFARRNGIILSKLKFKVALSLKKAVTPGPKGSNSETLWIQFQDLSDLLPPPPLAEQLSCTHSN